MHGNSCAIIIAIFILTALINYLLANGTPDAPKGSAEDVRPTVEYKAQSLRDPFSEYVKEEPSPRIKQEEAVVQPPALTLQGIIWGGRFSQAIINNKVVKVGDILEGAEIMEIGKQGVTVFFKNRTYTVSSPAATNLESSKVKKEGGKNEN